MLQDDCTAIRGQQKAQATPKSTIRGVIGAFNHNTLKYCRTLKFRPLVIPQESNRCIMSDDQGSNLKYYEEPSLARRKWGAERRTLLLSVLAY